MASETISFNPGDFNATRKALQGVLERVAERLIQELRKTAPVSTGRQGPFGRETGEHLKDSFSANVHGNTIEVVSTAPHFIPVIEGSEPHFITGNPFLVFPNKEFLLSNQKGRAIIKRRRSANSRGLPGQQLFLQFATTVVHRGHKANPFFKQAVSKLPRFIREELRK